MNALIFFGNYGMIHRHLPAFGAHHRVLVLDHQQEIHDVEHLDLFAQVMTLDQLNETELMHCLTEVHRAHPIEAVITPIETHVQVGAQIREAFAVPGTGVQAALRCRDKVEMKRVVQAAGIPCAMVLTLGAELGLEDAAAALGYPMVVKPRAGAGTVQTHLVEGPVATAALQLELQDALQGFIAESYIQGEEYHCDAFVDSKGRITSWTAGKYPHNALDAVKQQHLVGTVILRSCDIPFREELEHLLRHVVEATGVVSTLIHLEFFHTDKGLVFGEVACRVGGGPLIGVPIKHMYGFDLYRAFLQIQLEDQVATLQDPQENYGSLSLTSPQGTIADFTPAAEVETWPVVVESRVRARVGQHINGDLANTFSRIGYAVVKGSTPAEVLQHLENVHQQFTVVVAPA